MTFAEAIPLLLQGKILQSIHAGGWKIKMVDGVLVDVTHGYPSISGWYMEYRIYTDDLEVFDWEVTE